MTRIGLLGAGAAETADDLRVDHPDLLVGDAAVEDADVLVALGEDALLDTVESGVDTPVLPVDAGLEYGGVTNDALDAALAALADDDYETVGRQTVDAVVGDSGYRALADVTLVTSEPSQISEFEVRVDDEVVDEVRADGIVAATPAGSHGYAATAGGPLLDEAASAVVVVPISPFRVERVSWVLDPPVEITVTRDDSAVSAFADGRDCGDVSPGEPLLVEWGEPFTVAVVPQSRRVRGFGDSAVPQLE